MSSHLFLLPRPLNGFITRTGWKIYQLHVFCYYNIKLYGLYKQWCDISDWDLLCTVGLFKGWVRRACDAPLLVCFSWDISDWRSSGNMGFHEYFNVEHIVTHGKKWCMFVCLIQSFVSCRTLSSESWNMLHLITCKHKPEVKSALNFVLWSISKHAIWTAGQE